MQAASSEVVARSGRGVGYADLKVRSLLRQLPTDGGWAFSLNPYEGCELGCAFCPARLDRKDFGQWLLFEKRIAVKSNAAEVLRLELAESSSGQREIHLGTASDPYQPAEEHFRLTRAVLSVLQNAPPRALRVQTRSSLIARDTDLLAALSRKTKVTVTFSIASMDDRVNRLLEPKCPSVFRRLAALEALSRANVTVGLQVSPVMAGLDEDELGLEPLLSRAANAGAHFAGLSFMQFRPGQRESFLSHVTRAYPEMAARFRRVLGRRPHTDDERAHLLVRFYRVCERLGLEPIEPVLADKREERRAAPAQLNLFDAAP